MNESDGAILEQDCLTELAEAIPLVISPYKPQLIKQGKKKRLSLALVLIMPPAPAGGSEK
jgi:hypothetical protein